MLTSDEQEQRQRDAWAIREVHRVASKSKDTSRKTGAVIYERHSYAVLATGYNSLPEGVKDTPERRERPDKYFFTEHAERNAIYDLVRKGYSAERGIMYILWYPCAACARAIVQCNLHELVCYEPDWENIHNSEKWKDEFIASKQILEESSVKVRFLTEDFSPED